MKFALSTLLAALAILVLFVPKPGIAAAPSCGNLICEAGEDRSTCPSDCCMRVKNGICGFYPQCLQWDPDCCAPAACASSEHACSATNTKQACYPGYCSGAGSCVSACATSLQCASGYCPGSVCATRAASNGVAADGAQSCRECHSGGLCASCSACLSVNSQGYGVYKGDAVRISYEISNNCGSALSPVTLLVSGPLRKYAALSTVSFPSIASFETKRFYVTVSDIPPASYSYGALPPGEYELKLSATAGAYNAAYLSYVFLLPSYVFSSGMDVPANRVVGHSVRETLMKQDGQILPIELEVWAW